MKQSPIYVRGDLLASKPGMSGNGDYVLVVGFDALKWMYIVRDYRDGKLDGPTYFMSTAIDRNESRWKRLGTLE